MVNDNKKTEGSGTAVILTGGGCDLERVLARRLVPGSALVIAADSGYLKAEPLGLIPRILVGDFDSIPTDAMPDSAEVPEIIAAPCEKDETDTMLACEIAMERGCSRVLIVGGFGGRCDHELSNIFWLENLKNRGVDAAMTDGNGLITVIRDETVELEKHGGYFSVFALDSCTVSLSGCKYPLVKTKLHRDIPYAVSNEITEDRAVVSVEGTADRKSVV